MVVVVEYNELGSVEFGGSVRLGWVSLLLVLFTLATSNFVAIYPA